VKRILWFAPLIVAYGLFPAGCLAAFIQVDLVSDIPGMALATDPNMENPWGMSFSSTSPVWVSDQGSNKATLYNALAPSIVQGLVVTTQTAGLGPPTGTTGQVFNSTASDFMIPGPTGPVKASCLFDSLDGTIQGWNPGSNGGRGASEIVTTNPGSVFTGLAMASAGGANYYLFAADATGRVMVLDSSFNNVTGTTFAGKFVDPNPVVGFTPYNIANLGGNLFVTYAAAGPGGSPLPGGYVDEFDSSGNFIERIATNGAIDAPWGLAIAPAGFGEFGGDLLVGNLYNSVINAYNLTSRHLDGSITVSSGFASPVGLWALEFGNGVTGSANTLYFTDGVNNQRDGLFGSITFTPEPSSVTLIWLGFVVFGCTCRWRKVSRNGGRG
jgi:uncharacterized protein (TIGR03118 family)